MKNLFLSVVLLLSISFAFAANNVEKVSAVDVENTIELTNSIESSTETIQTFLDNLENTGYTTVLKKVVIDDFFCIETHYVYVKGRYIGSFEIETNGVNGECGVTIHWT